MRCCPGGVLLVRHTRVSGQMRRPARRAPRQRRGPLAALELAGGMSLGVIHLGGLSGGVNLEDPAAVARQAWLFGYLRAAAVSPGGSARLIRDIAAGNRPGQDPG